MTQEMDPTGTVIHIRDFRLQAAHWISAVCARQIDLIMYASAT